MVESDRQECNGALASMAARKAAWLCLLPLAAAILCQPPIAHAALGARSVPQVVIVEEQGSYPLGYSVEILQDQDGKLGIEDVLKEETGARFIPLGRIIANLGRSGGAWWLRVEIFNSTDKPFSAALEEESPLIDSIEVYTANPGGGYARHSPGADGSGAGKGTWQRSYIYDLDFYPQEIKTLYIRVAADGDLAFPLTLWSWDALAAEEAGRGYIMGTLFGAVAFMAFFALCVFAFTRDICYRDYALYILAGLGYCLSINGWIRFALFPDSPVLAKIALCLMILALTMTAARFTRTFLDTINAAPGADRALSRLVMVSGAMAALGLVPAFYSTISHLGYIIFVALAASLVALGWKERGDGVRWALLYTIAWIAVLLGVATAQATNAGWLGLHFGRAHGLEIGLAANMALLAVAMAHKERLRHM